MKNAVKVKLTTLSGLTEYFYIDEDLKVVNEYGQKSFWFLAKYDKIEVVEDSL